MPTVDYFRHVTLNTGHIRDSYVDDIDVSIYFRVRNIIGAAKKPEGVEVYPGVTLTVLQENNYSYVATMSARGDEVPVLLSAATLYDDGELWRLMHKVMPYQSATDPDVPPVAPYIADVVICSPPEVGDFFTSGISGDLCKCLAWFILAPKQVRPLLEGGGGEE